MYKLILTLLLAPFFSSVSAKSPTEGIAIYKETVNVHASLSKEQAAMKAFVPEFKYSEYKVLFKNNLFRLEKNDTKNSRVTSLASNTVILNHNDKTVIQYGKMAKFSYKINESLGDEPILTFVDESRIINGYQCKKAVDSENEITIWYQENITKIAPQREFFSVPGIVIKVEGKLRSFDLVSLSETSVKESAFSVPKEYKKISRGQLNDLREEAVEALRSSMGAGVRTVETVTN